MEHSLAATLWRLVGLVALVCANGFLVAAEFSIVTVLKTRIDQMIAEGHRGARAVHRFLRCRSQRKQEIHVDSVLH